MTDATTAAESCGCCQSADKTTDDVVNELLARREAVDERLRRLELVGVGR